MTKIISRRLNADGHRIEWCDDGRVYAVGRGSRALNNDAAILLMGEISLYGDAEFGRACEAAKRAVAQTNLAPLTYFRAVMAGKKIKYGRSAWGHVAAVCIEDAA